MRKPQQPEYTDLLSPSALEQVKLHKSIALAVSGGPDSLAMMYLLARWASQQSAPPKITVLTVDHGLRPEAVAETQWVAEQAANFGLPAHILTWNADKPSSNLQEAAREARYALLLEYCEADGITALLTAHHQNDQAETVLMRLMRGSGVDGLSAIPEVTKRKGVELIRPLLGTTKMSLIDLLSREKINWISDPSNASTDFERVRVRNLLKQLESQGLSASDLALTAKRAQRARSALDHIATEFLSQSAKLYPAGYCQLDRLALQKAPAEIALRALSKCLFLVGGQPRPPRLAKLEDAFIGLGVGDNATVTLGGCVIRGDHTRWTIMREMRKNVVLDAVVEPGNTLLWDNRFLVAVHDSFQQSLTVRFLGHEGVNAMNHKPGDQPERPNYVIPTFVSFWHDAHLLYVPHLNYCAPVDQIKRSTLSQTHLQATFVKMSEFP